MERVSDITCAVGESPTWSAAESAFYWTDIPAKRVWRLDLVSGATRFWALDEMAGCVATRADGGLIVLCAEEALVWRDGAIRGRLPAQSMR